MDIERKDDRLSIRLILKCVFWVCVLELVVTPLSQSLLTDTAYLDLLWRQLWGSASVFAVVWALLTLARWAALHVLKLDTRGRMPWYASPLLWLPPLCLLMLYLMFVS